MTQWHVGRHKNSSCDIGNVLRCTIGWRWLSQRFVYSHSPHLPGETPEYFQRDIHQGNFKIDNWITKDIMA